MSVLHGSFLWIVHIFKLNILIYSPFPTHLCDLTDCRLPGCCSQDFPGKNTGVGCHFFSRGSSQPRDWTLTPTSALQVDYLPRLWGKLKALKIFNRVLRLLFLQAYTCSPITSASASPALFQDLIMLCQDYWFSLLTYIVQAYTPLQDAYHGYFVKMYIWLFTLSLKTQNKIKNSHLCEVPTACRQAPGLYILPPGHL